MKDISGKVFNDLTVIKKTEEKSNNDYLWLCKCKCGNFTKVKNGT